MPEATRKILIQQGKSDRYGENTKAEQQIIIEVPEKCKVTFGPISPKGPPGPNALRIYETQSKQLACFTNVMWFRDLSIPVKRKVIEVVSKDEHVSDSVGNVTAKSETLVDESEWEDDTLPF